MGPVCGIRNRSLLPAVRDSCSWGADPQRWHHRRKDHQEKGVNLMETVGLVSAVRRTCSTLSEKYSDTVTALAAAALARRKRDTNVFFYFLTNFLTSFVLQKNSYRDFTTLIACLKKIRSIFCFYYVLFIIAQLMPVVICIAFSFQLKHYTYISFKREKSLILWRW
jgi:hypothetical protein